MRKTGSPTLGVTPINWRLPTNREAATPQAGHALIDG